MNHGDWWWNSSDSIAMKAPKCMRFSYIFIRITKSCNYHPKMIPIFHMYPLVIWEFAMENGHGNSGFSHESWWIFPVRYVSHYQRISIFKNYFHDIFQIIYVKLSEDNLKVSLDPHLWWALTGHEGPIRSSQVRSVSPYRVVQMRQMRPVSPQAYYCRFYIYIYIYT